MADKALDPLLQEFVDAPNESEAHAALERVIEAHVLPLAQRIARYRLRSWPSGSARVLDRDADDVVSEAMTTLIERLHAVRSDPAAAPVANLLNYSAKVVHSTVAHLGRRRYPERARLKSRLRYVCSTSPELRLWTTKEGDLVCGLRAWRGQDERPAAAAALRTAVSGHHVSWNQLTPKGLAGALGTVFRMTGSAVSFESLVEAVATSAQLVEPRVVTDVVDLPSVEDAQDMVLDRTRRLFRVWQEVCALPVPQRAALLLNLRHTTGAGLLWLLPVLRVATIRQIAAALDMPFAELAQLWQHLPLDDASIATRLGCTRQQVINLRMAARKRLANRFRRLATPSGNIRAGRDNLARVSTSWRTRE